MAKKDVSFVDKHLEKVILGVCAAGFLGAVYYGFAGGRFSVNDRSAAELIQAAADAAEQARQAVQSARYNPPRKETESDPKNDPVAQLAEWFGPEAKGLLGMAELPKSLPRAGAFGPPLVSIMRTAPEDRRNLARFVSPDLPVLSSGRSTFRFLRSKPELESFDPRQREDQTTGKVVTANWVSVAAQVDLVEQQSKFLAERYPEGTTLQIAKVHLQRRDVNDPGGAWEDVETFLPFKEPRRPILTVLPDGRMRVQGMEAYRSLLDEMREAIVLTPFGQYQASGDKVELPAVPYLDEPPDREAANSPTAPNPGRFSKRWLDWANAALKGRKPFKDVDPYAALVLTRGVVGLPGVPEKDVAAAQAILDRLPEKLPRELRPFAKSSPRDPRRLMPILAHDLTPVPGHTYVYRIRYEVLNIFAGNTGELRNPRDAQRLTVFSDWSPESRPVEIKSDTYFYLTKADKAKNEVTVAVFKVTRAGASRQEFKISAGEEIGKKDKRPGRPDFSTGTVCVDIDFDRGGGKNDATLVYANASDGVLFERSLARDLKDPIYKRLSDLARNARP
ncbi:MAG: hypothetical protein HBSAPP02_20700 [Phycisphaerae bacterium]|nr:MAG: hypothetical protein HRU71_05275 [Planctomycetia bacterium]RIK69952.1 MAG: hypothetical protein DCC66_06980 [Planctomycetota bacterium]GJQ27038.1 MAG: hypothetical protein HBSAPP02_20700 [Phycisphaerae bacterium]